MSILNLQGAYENELETTGEFNPQAPKTALMLPSGQRVVLPTEVLLEAMSALPTTAGASTASRVDSEGTARDGASAVGLPAAAAPAVRGAAERRDVVDDEAGQVIPLIEEQMLVGKTEVETGRVRVRRETEEHVQTVSVPLTEVRWEVEHVPVEQVVDAQPEIRQVGDTIIFPLVEERMVVKRELWLREEVHMRKVTSTVEKSADFAVKRDVLVESRSDTAR